MQCIDHVGIGRLVVEQRHVVAHRAGEQLDLLGDERHAPAQLGQRDVGDRNAAERRRRRRSVRRVAAPAGERGLAAAGAPDDADGTSGTDPDRDVAQHRAVVAVVEVHVVDVDRERPGRRARVALVEHLGFHGQEVDHADHRTVRLLHRLEFVHDLLERAGDQQHVLEQQERRADR